MQARKTHAGRAFRQEPRAPAGHPVAIARARPADIYLEQKVSVAGFKAPIDAVAWLVSEVTPSLGSQGFLTALQLETAP